MGSRCAVEAADEIRERATRPRPTVVCVTPVRNEAWTLDRFLRCAERWADRIVIADQGSEDDTRAIAEASPKTVVVRNNGEGYDEAQYKRVLLDAARSIDGPRAIIAVDADEALSANIGNSLEWEQALRSPPGTVLTAEWINYLPGATNVWVPKTALPIGFIDDGRPHRSGRFHVDRVTVRPGDRCVSLDPVKLLHFQYLDWRRMKSKQRRYQCAEALSDPRKRPIQFYRQYHRMDAPPHSEVRPADPTWLAAYEQSGIDMTGVEPEATYWTDEEVLAMLIEHGPSHFRRLDVWDVDWPAVAKSTGKYYTGNELADPRTTFDKLVYRWLAETQRRGPDRPATRLLQRILIPLGW